MKTDCVSAHPAPQEGSYEHLRALWYAKLRESGFVDIELTDGRLADHNQLPYAVDTSPLVRQANSEYFAAAASYLANTRWENLMERRVWSLHSRGQSFREIAAAVRRTLGYVQRCVVRHRVEAGLKRPLKSSPARET